MVDTTILDLFKDEDAKKKEKMIISARYSSEPRLINLLRRYGFLFYLAVLLLYLFLEELTGAFMVQCFADEDGHSRNHHQGVLEKMDDIAEWCHLKGTFLFRCAGRLLESFEEEEAYAQQLCLPEAEPLESQWKHAHFGRLLLLQVSS